MQAQAEACKAVRSHPGPKARLSECVVKPLLHSSTELTLSELVAANIRLITSGRALSLNAGGGGIEQNPSEKLLPKEA